jgi:transposase InsO family protein
MVGGVPLISHLEEVCHACLAGKQARMSFPQAAQWRASKPLELLHIDLCGPITPSTAAGNRYFMLIVDDCTRWVAMYVLKTKDQACDAFARFKSEAENQLDAQIKTVRSDRGGEFLSMAFRDVCEKAGIKRQFTAPYSPQQNGVVERRNRTMMEMARSLMNSMGVPARFWGEAVRHSVYLLNCLSTKAMGNCTPYEAWKGRKPHLGHLRVFGCTANVRNAAPHLKKLDVRSHKMIYLGVEIGCKAHRLYDPKHNKIVVSKDVIFEENVKWKWGAQCGDVEVFEFQVQEDNL